MNQDSFKWVNDNMIVDLALIARCGQWKAELATEEPYTPGLVIIRTTKEIPKKLGDGSINDFKSLFKLIDEISNRMRESLECTVHGATCRCENVYLLSLNENVGNSSLHFRLWPRYSHDYEILNLVDETGQKADALALMAERRQKFLVRQSTNKWDEWPPSRDKNYYKWMDYALKIRKMIIPNPQKGTNNES